ncbi:MAG: hypothetical protein AAGK22_29460 [Acidobacteriota bacterium]
MTLDRRALLRLLGAAAITWSASPSWAGQQTAGAEALPGVPGAEDKALEDLAKAYERLGEDPELPHMIERLRARTLEHDTLAEELRREMKADFAEDRIVALHGWYVSRTEGRLLAAAHHLLKS